MKTTAAILTVLAACCLNAPASSLETGWANPPLDARLRAYWWWLNGNITKAAITRDLEELKAKGFGGALICDADGSSQDGNDRAPHGPDFFSPAWRELYKHALHEADRLGLEMSLNIQSGWNLGGPMVKPDDAPKKLVWTETRVEGGKKFSDRLEQPKSRDNYYRDLFVIGCRLRPHEVSGVQAPAERRPIKNQLQKALLKPLQPFSAPVSTPLFEEFPAVPGEEDVRAVDVLDLTSRLKDDGTLTWKVPSGEWVVLRLGCTLNDHCRVSTCSQGWDGYAIDPFDAGAFQRYWAAVVEPLLRDAGTFAGKTLKYLHTDSWEVEVANWTPMLRQEFQRCRGYDLVPWLPVITGKIVNGREESNRFLNDFRRTMGDLAIDHHYKLFKEGARKHGLLIHPESGGPHAVPIDAQQCLGFTDAPMSEFWAWSWRHRVGDENRFFVKQPASAAHTYGHKLVLAEGFTTIGPHWQETLWDNLKPAFDHACTEGLNLLVWHAVVCSPAEQGIPGQQYFAGTHLNPNVTWWGKSKPFFDYINRCQFMLQQGLPVADVAYYYGDHVPNFSQRRSSDPAKVGAGYDYDVLTAEALLTRATVRDGKIQLNGGMSYRLLVLPDRDMISLPVLHKVKELVDRGATVIGPRLARSSSLKNFEGNDAEVVRLGERLWGGKTAKGRFITGRTAREILTADGVQLDFESDAPVRLDYIHRCDCDAEIYFVANRTNLEQTAICTFRVSGKAPELWNPVTGNHRFAAAYEEKNGRTFVPLHFDACGSWFVVFREPAADHPPTLRSNNPTLSLLAEISGPWEVRFDTNWGGPASIRLDQLASWSKHVDPRVKFYSGTAAYQTTLTMTESARTPGRRLVLELGNVRELAEVRINGKSCGVTWAPPFRVDVTEAAKQGENQLAIEVVNFWPNRIIGDASIPVDKRLTRTNIRKLNAETPLMESGLLGPVRLLNESR
jgi:hypothetical protein